MKITIIGTGYVGLVTGTCLAELGNEIKCIDIDKDRISMLENGKPPIYEPGLKEMLEKNIYEERISFYAWNDERSNASIRSSDIIFLCVGTPQDEQGSADTSYLKEAVETMSSSLGDGSIVVIKSTVPVGTNEKIKKQIARKTEKSFYMASMPEFLREGAAIKDFMNPDRIIIGTESKKAKETLHELMKPLERIYQPIVHTTIKSAEMIKHTANSFLAMKISFINEVANLCEKAGADINDVYRGIALDTRIGHRFLQAGIGYGGSCFPKDVRALINTGEKHGTRFSILESVDEVNKKQKYIIIDKLTKHLKDLKEKRITILGLAFKPRTDDIREAPAIYIAKRLLELDADVTAFDPIAQDNAKKVLPEISFADDPYDALKDANAVLIATEWDEFRGMSTRKMRALMENPLVIDGRNIYDKEKMLREGFIYEGIGR